MIRTFKETALRIFHRHSLPRWLVFIMDVSFVFLSFFFAYLLRFNLVAKAVNMGLAFDQAILVTAVYALFMLIFKSYSGLIRHTTIKDAYNIFLTTSISLLILLLLSLFSRVYGWRDLFDIPLSILMIHYGILTILLFFFRVFIKMFYEFASASTSEKKSVAIFGAGEMGIVVRRMLESDNRSGYRIKWFVDDNKKLQGKKVDGIPVLSPRIITRELLRENNIKVVVLAINKLSRERRKEILEAFIEFGVEVLETPSFDTWLNGELQVKNLRKVNLEDLLGRDPIKLDLEKIEKGLRGKTIMVTGAAGSIGSEIVRQLIKYDVGRLILIDQAETPSFYLENELRLKNGIHPFHIIIGDITNRERMDQVFSAYKPEIVFHAAAYKHVPVMESHPHEAFRVNVGGTKIVSDLAIQHKVEKFVYVSTDKAVNPTNVMGATKKLCELLIFSQSNRKDSKTQFVTTRFGNVLGSNGSVIPLFKKQIENGGPITVTDPDIKRFFMTIPEACELVLEAGFMGNGGEIFVFDMGKPVKIMDIAIQLIRLSGLEPYEDIKIKVTGLRPGEKLYEELFAPDEIRLQTHNPKIEIAKLNSSNENHITTRIDEILSNLYSSSPEEIKNALKELVPGYTTSSTL